MDKQLTPIAFLPWLTIEARVQIGKVVFWPYDAMKSAMLPNEYPVDELDKYASAYRAANDKQAVVTCVSYPIAPRQKLTLRQSTEVQVARAALFASGFMNGIHDPSDPNIGMRMPSAEHYAMRPLPPPENVAKGTFGLFFPRLQVIGSSIETARFDKPEHLHTCLGGFFKPLYIAVDRLIRGGHCPAAPYVRRSLEWFFHAHTSQEHFSEEARIVVLCMAIEAALQEVKTGRKEFIERVGKATAGLHLPKRLRCLKYTSLKGLESGERGRFSRIEAWASDFYELRKRLVHAKADKATSLVWRTGHLRFMHYYIASYVWFECLWHTMNQTGVIPVAPKETGGSSLADILRYAKWYWAWQSDIESLRERWRELLTGTRVDD